MLSETSAVFLDVVEHPTRVPTTAIASMDKHGLNVFILSPLIANYQGEKKHGRAAPQILSRRIFSPRCLNALQNRKAQEYDCTHYDPHSFPTRRYSDLSYHDGSFPR